MKKSALQKVCGVFLLMLLSSACASSFRSNLESAQFSLDGGDYTAAINSATKALSSDPGNVAASRLLASAYLGRSGISYLDLASELSNLPDSEETTYRTIANVLPDSDDPAGLLADLHAAVTTLESLDGLSAESLATVDGTIADDDLANAAFDLGILKMIEHFAIGVYQSNYFEASVDESSVASITDDDQAVVQADLIDFDNLVLAAGVDDFEDTLSEIRQTFCILEPLSADEGFTTSELQALVGCQLADDPSAFNTAEVDAGIASCNDLEPDNQSDDVQACFDVDTAL